MIVIETLPTCQHPVSVVVEAFGSTVTDYDECGEPATQRVLRDIDGEWVYFCFEHEQEASDAD